MAPVSPSVPRNEIPWYDAEPPWGPKGRKLVLPCANCGQPGAAYYIHRRTSGVVTTRSGYYFCASCGLRWGCRWTSRLHWRHGRLRPGLFVLDAVVLPAAVHQADFWQGHPTR